MSATTSNSRLLITFTIIGAIGIIAILLTIFIRGRQARQAALLVQEQQFSSPSEAVISQVRSVLMRQELPDGTIQYIEILANGKVNVYDADMNLLKTGLQGYANIQNLFNKINRNLEQFTQVNSANTSGIKITVITNKGTYVIYIEDEIAEVVEEIIKNIEDIKEETFAPTPTPLPTPPPISTVPTSSPTPTSLPNATPTPYHTPTPGPSPTPTPLPDYMTAPPFDCETYKQLNRPVTISNIVCGAD